MRRPSYTSPLNVFPPDGAPYRVVGRPNERVRSLRAKAPVEPLSIDKSRPLFEQRPIAQMICSFGAVTAAMILVIKLVGWPA